MPATRTDGGIGASEEPLAELRSPRTTRPPVMRYGAAVAVVALALQALLVPLFGMSPEASPFLVFFAALDG